MTEPAQQEREYALGHSAQELDRLTMQAKLLEPFTRRSLSKLGLARA